MSPRSEFLVEIVQQKICQQRGDDSPNAKDNFEFERRLRFRGNRVRLDVCHIRLYVYDIWPAPARPRKPSGSIVLASCSGRSINFPRLSSDWRKTAPFLRDKPTATSSKLKTERARPVSEAKLAFTVKLPHSLIQRVRSYAAVKGLSISEVVSRALFALLPRGRGRG